MYTNKMRDLLRTDAYKLSMAQAGFPLRQETFYFSFRRGGWQFVPFDLETEIHAVLEASASGDEVEAQLAFADEFGYTLSPAMRQALAGEVSITAVPAGTWVAAREPILTVTGPSFLVSWLEPLVLRFHHTIQFATALRRGNFEPAMGLHVGPAHADLLGRAADAVDAACPELRDERADYALEVKARGRALVECLGSGDRIFEVGMRAAVTPEQHLIALENLAKVGIHMTSNVAAARGLGLRPVGTMGHEHVQRWGDDLSAFRAMRDMRGGVPSYLLDTFDTIRSGIPNAIRVMCERAHSCSIRYDSGDKFAQYMYAHGEFSRAGLSPVHILEDGLGLEDTVKFERLREFTGLGVDKQVYGYGGYLVARPSKNPLTRDKVAAVYKLGQTSGDARMKFGNEAGLGKRSVPGQPVVWRRLRGTVPLSVIAQAGEPVPDDYLLLSGNPEARKQLNLVKAEVGLDAPDAPAPPYTLSPETTRLEAELEAIHAHARS